jgi:hypothetical protein
VFRERKPSVRWVLPDGQYNPVVAEGVRWLDYELAADAVPVKEGTSPEGSATLERADVPGDTRPRDLDAPDRDLGVREDVRSQDFDVRFPDLDVPDGGRFPGLDRPDGGRSRGLDRPDDGRSGGFGEAVAADDWFDLPQRPPRLADCRPYGVPGGLAQPDPHVQRDLAEALPPGVRFPDPRGTWVRLVNGGGPADDPFRASNAADCALAVLSTWYGEPATAAPRLPEYDRIGRPVLTGERGSVDRIEGWTGQHFQYLGQGRHAYPMMVRRLLDAGHGASAVIVVRWPGGGSHAWNAVNFGGEVIWIDAQRGHMSVEPPYTTVTGVFCVILDRQGRPR